MDITGYLSLNGTGGESGAFGIITGQDDIEQEAMELLGFILFHIKRK